MLKIFISLLFILSLNASANVAFEVKGKLKLFRKSDNSKMEIILKSNEGEFKITNKNYFTYGCKKGEFLIVSNYVPEDTYSIIEILNCKKFGDDQVDSFCPKNLDLVCGAPIDFRCENYYCDELELTPQTYSNRCDLLRNGARFLYQGSCRP
ncbi:MAG: hypothetical protein DRQ88_05490 [Epsilonproteobacteria bacterium]|nr:MAG: hypothetical protein DRQ89_08505 [Campylobacterota bacterium]RLA66769.1 MAG: hypothetical protein DRQ88_05490 [Campylobacterota bacterium]